MHKVTLCSLFILNAFLSTAQNQYDLVGALFLDEARPISYRLLFRRG